MKAIVLAGGRGSRMADLTLNTPKPLIKVAGKPLMEYVIDALRRLKVEEIGINLFYLGDQIENHFGNGSRYGVKITYVKEKELTGTAGAVQAVSQVIAPKEPFLVLPADWIGNYDLKSFYRFHLKKKALLSLCCMYKPRDPIASCGVLTFDRKTKKIIKYVEKPQIKSEIISFWANSGIYVFDPDVVSLIPKRLNSRNVVDIPKDLFPILLSSNKDMYAYQINRNRFYQLGINSQDQIYQAEKDLKEGIVKPSTR